MINIEKQKTRLLTKQQELVEELNHIGIKSPDGSWMVIPDKDDGTHADSVDNADTTEDFEEKIVRLNVLEIQHAQVQKALGAISMGTYGVCEVSGEQIPEDRLLANPSATTTVTHAK
jgi:RNA polymerase-binding transcription factor DksA